MWDLDCIHNWMRKKIYLHNYKQSWKHITFKEALLTKLSKLARKSIYFSPAVRVYCTPCKLTELGNINMLAWKEISIISTGHQNWSMWEAGLIDRCEAANLGNFSLNKQDYVETATFSLRADQHFFKSDSHIFCNSNHWFDDISIISGSCFGDNFYSTGKFLAWECILV